MCQNTGSLRVRGSGFLSTMLHPISPRLSGEFSMQTGSSCVQALAVASRKITAMQQVFMEDVMVCPSAASLAEPMSVVNRPIHSNPKPPLLAFVAVDFH